VALRYHTDRWCRLKGIFMFGMLNIHGLAWRLQALKLMNQASSLGNHCRQFTFGTDTVEGPDLKRISVRLQRKHKSKLETSDRLRATNPTWMSLKKRTKENTWA
jgi:hypothetical protein